MSDYYKEIAMNYLKPVLRENCRSFYPEHLTVTYKFGDVRLKVHSYITCRKGDYDRFTDVQGTIGKKTINIIGD